MNTKKSQGGSQLAKLAFDTIPEERADAKEVTALIKENRKVVGYELANEQVVSKEEAINLAEKGKIKNVGIAHKKDTKYLKSIPDGSDDNNLSSLPTKSKKSKK